MRKVCTGLAVAFALAFPVTAPAGTPGDADVAALQIGLHTLGLYRADIDGLAGTETLAGLRRLPGATTPVSAATRAALGEFGSHPLGSRPLVLGTSGWDVAALQFLLAWHGFPCGTLDGAFGMRTAAALVRFQDWAGIPPIGVAGPQTLAALRLGPALSPLRLAPPLALPATDGFRPRGDRFHPGLDIPAPSGTPVAAAGDGVVIGAGWVAGYGQLVQVQHDLGVTSLYAHLSVLLVSPGQRVTQGATVGLVGSTGESTGPHLHFEVRLRGAAVDPAPALG